MKGFLNKTEEGWMMTYNVFQNDYSYRYPAYNIIPLYPDNALYCLDADQGKEVEFDIVEKIPESCYNNPFCEGNETCIQCYVKYAKLSPSDIRKRALAFIANQSQELNMGYEPEWDNFFEESEKVLNFELPLRYKNWLINKYKNPPTLKNEK
jgi:hypothetical protein